MGLIKKAAGSKKFWTREQDEALVALCNEGKSVAEIAAVVGHPELSVSYRIRKIGQLDSLDKVNYRS